MFDQNIDLAEFSKNINMIKIKYDELNIELTEHLKYKLININDNLNETVNKFIPLYLPHINGLANQKDTLVNNFAKFMIKYKQTHLLNTILHFNSIIERVLEMMESNLSKNEDYVIFSDIDYEYVAPNGIRIFIANEEKNNYKEYMKDVLKKFVMENENDLYYSYEYVNRQSTIFVKLKNKILYSKIKKTPYTIQISSLKYLEQSISHMIKMTKRNTSNFKDTYQIIKKWINRKVKNPNVILDIVPFGSVTQLSHNIKSDLEVTIITESLNESFVNEVYDILKSKFNDAYIKYTSRTQIITFTNNEVKVELMFNNYLGVINSDLIRRYCLFDTRVAIMLNVVKDWSKNHQINGNFNKYLSSYCYTLMIIFFLQKIFPIIPVLQNKNDCTDLFVGNKEEDKWHYLIDNIYDYDVTYFRTGDYSVAELVYHFFYFYRYTFNEAEYAIDITNDKYVYRDECITFIEGSSLSNDRSAYYIVDPFDYSYNPANYMKRRTTEHNTFNSAMEKAMEKIRDCKNIFINQ
jgi:DNA polymerase sigma